MRHGNGVIILVGDADMCTATVAVGAKAYCVVP